MEKKYTDLEIVKGIKAKKQFAFDYFYDHYAPAFYGEMSRSLLKEESASEALKQVMNYIWTHIDEYDFQQSLFSWSLKVVRKLTCRQKMNLALFELFSCQLPGAAPQRRQAVV